MEDAIIGEIYFFPEGEPATSECFAELVSVPSKGHLETPCRNVIFTGTPKDITKEQALIRRRYVIIPTKKELDKYEAAITAHYLIK